MVEKEKPSDGKLIRARRIRIFPTPDQKNNLHQWFGAVRFLYNRAVEESRKPNVESSELTLKSLRAKFMNSTDWLKKVPYDIRDGALRDFDKARKAFFAKRRKVKATNLDAVVKATFQFKSRLKKQQCFVMRGTNWGRTRGVFSSLFGVDKITSSEPIPESLETEFRVVVDRLGHYFLCIPRSIPIRSDNQAPKSGEGVVSLDPGIRTFKMCYSADGFVTE